MLTPLQRFITSIEDRIATFETQSRTANDIASWFHDAHAFVTVADGTGEIVGYAIAQAYADRCCYRGIGEFSVYVRRNRRRQGIGQLAMKALIEHSRTKDLWKLISRIFPENEASLSLLMRMGFRVVGVHEKHRKLDGVWKDCVLVELLIPENID
ncbi:MAG TPA: arsinothricin resistance N-acetyltransferase ArsN1 family A [Terriglobales bacterium]|jgi:phosphinothricin acetyltransferase|nr:arsinothricin resistance N-acetyltransferase ArsN1 family A [Terriglobales bacterium]